jgi:hypothetical protein
MGINRAGPFAISTLQYISLMLSKDAVRGRCPGLSLLFRIYGVQHFGLAEVCSVAIIPRQTNSGTGFRRCSSEFVL